MIDCIIVGGGIIGATIAKGLTKAGQQVLVFDSKEPFAGTTPSGGHLKPSWLGMSPKIYHPLLDLLDELWGLKEEQFKVLPENKPDTVYRLDTDKVNKYKASCKQEKVTWLDLTSNFPRVCTEQNEYRCKMVVVAAGVWCNNLLQPQGWKYSVKSKQGVSFRCKGVIKYPFISTWAPYKQIVCHQQSPNELWIGDGTAILAKNWKQTNVEACRTRCLKALSSKVAVESVTKTLIGQRPVLDPLYKGEPCYMDQVFPKVWVVTGSSKRGTIAAAWATQRLMELFK